MKNEKSNHKTEGLPIKREDRIHLIQQHVLDTLGLSYVPKRTAANSMGFRISAYGQTKESAKYLLDKHMPNLTVGLIITSYFTDKYKEIADLDLPTALILSY